MRETSGDGGYSSQRVTAGALSLVLVIGILVSTILLGLVLFYAGTRTLLQQHRIQLQVQQNTRSGIAYLLATPTLPYFQRVDLDLFGSGDDSVVVEKRPWGIFDLVRARASKNNFRDSLIGLVGSRFDPSGQVALYIANDDKPVSMVGSSQVVGDAYLPTLGIRSAYLGTQELPAPTKLVTGRTLPRTTAAAPAVPPPLTCLQQYAALDLSAWLPANSQTLEKLRSVERSFYRPPLVWLQTQPATIRAVTLSGQILLVSTHKLVIEADAHLDNVVVMAPVVVIKAGFHGRLQVFARDTVEIGADSQLAYPSAVCAFSTTGVAKVFLAERSQVHGVVIAANPPGSAATSLVRMHQSSRVVGQLHVEGVLENCGQVTGTVRCRQLLYSTIASFYENYLVDATIDREQLPADYLTTPRLNPQAGLGILAWLP
ncbi:hypothetical protein J0X19_24445 [Hymenobacter sp. BT186]|uniref:Uncharacterized protein n=1 Tax=Hymenobacter telluris TaxID=2816474 RepID=A0A939F1L2_9BACT|nr:hypothetical protein [Hymenobacter telluris]MBO0361131.1 hypothetical protein [Hymenobacter telluris]MBW3377159.1 hypothetical protein [Hymenobacter norwichensis]